MKFKHIEQLEKFSKDLKKLLKKFPSLKEDLETFIKVQVIAYHKYDVDIHDILLIEGISIKNPKFLVI